MINTWLALLVIAGSAVTAPETDPVVVLPPLDHQKLLVADLDRAKQGQPVRYAVPNPVSGVSLKGGTATAGQWSALTDGRWRWSFSVAADGASSVDLGFGEYWLPHGAELWITDGTGKLRHGPYTDAHNNRHRELWTPVVPGEVALVELTVPAAVKDHASLALIQANYGYRFYNEAAVAKSLSCNVDVVCPAGDDYRDQIRAVATYTNGSSGGICSGTLLNNTAEDTTPYFLTANHCEVSEDAAPSLVFYFNYESDVCREGADSGNPLPRSIGDTVSGATLVASNGESDFTLLQLSQSPPESYGVFYAGWDRRDVAPTMAAGIHHPRTEEKRISIEFDPVIDNSITRNFGFTLEPFTYWEVREWDLGITEGGSSGSGLFNQDRRLVGQLAGGARFSCPGAEEGSDVYGKFSLSWDAGATPDARLRDWLDPIGSDVELLDGVSGCDEPQVTVTGPEADVTVGEPVLFGAQITGGTPPYQLEWDLDGDGEVDSRLDAFEARFNRGGQTDVRLSVTDSLGCPATVNFGVPVSAPRIEIGSVDAPREACGDGDDDIEQGETWRFPVRLVNSGDAEAVDLVAGFAASELGAAARIPPDDFGYTLLDSGEGACPFNALDISDSGEELEIQGMSNPRDEGVATVELGGSAAFDLYGEGVTMLGMSTNGYLSTSADDEGRDFDNDCPLPRPPDDGGGARIMPLHDDLVATGGLYHQYFETCPRPADSGAPDQGCDVMQWDDMEYFRGAAGQFDFQAILYEESFEIVYQYPAGNPESGDSSTTGIQNATFDVAQTYACNTAGSLPVDGAVCIFHPDSAPPAKSDRIRLLTPAVSVDRLAPGASAVVMVDVYIEEDFPCGSFFAADFLGAGFRGGFSDTGTGGILSAEVRPGSCASNVTCATTLPPTLQPREGFWFNALRPGNGMDLHFGPGLYAAWYTAKTDRTPIWYYIQTLDGQELRDKRISASLLEFRGPVGNGLSPGFEEVGEALFSFVDESRALMTWTLNGRQDGELIQFFDLDNAPVDPDVTDQWFNPDESGWGFGIHRQGSEEFAAVYFYDVDELPVWTVVLETGMLRSTGESRLGAFLAHCPGCVWTTPTFVDAGRLLRRFDTPDDGTVDIQVDTTLPVEIDWQRLGLPIRPIRSIVRE